MANSSLWSPAIELFNGIAPITSNKAIASNKLRQEFNHQEQLTKIRFEATSINNTYNKNEIQPNTKTNKRSNIEDDMNNNIAAYFQLFATKNFNKGLQQQQQELPETTLPSLKYQQQYQFSGNLMNLSQTQAPLRQSEKKFEPQTNLEFLNAKLLNSFFATSLQQHLLQFYQKSKCNTSMIDNANNCNKLLENFQRTKCQKIKSARKCHQIKHLKNFNSQAPRVGELSERYPSTIKNFNKDSNLASLNPITPVIFADVTEKRDKPIEIKNHLSMNLNSCAICGATFRITSDLVQHMRFNHRQSKYKRKSHNDNNTGIKNMDK